MIKYAIKHLDYLYTIKLNNMKDVFWQLIRVNLVPDSSNKQGYTEGEFYTHNGYLCDTLEDTVRDMNADGDLLDEYEEKIMDRTAIPYAIYELVVTFSPKFKRDMVLVKDVKHFSGVRLHWGRSNKNTSGCPLLGKKYAEGKLNNIGMTDKVVEMVSNLTESGHRVFLEIVNPLD